MKGRYHIYLSQDNKREQIIYNGLLSANDCNRDNIEAITKEYFESEIPTNHLYIKLVTCFKIRCQKNLIRNKNRYIRKASDLA